MKIFKYELNAPTGIDGCMETCINMPSGAKVLSVQEQNGCVQVWAAVNPDNTSKPRRFLVIPTGYPFDVGVLHQFNFVTTLQLSYDSMVFHIFEERQ